MIREAAMLHVKEGFEGEFEEAFRRAEPIMAGMKGYLVPFLVQMHGGNA